MELKIKHTDDNFSIKSSGESVMGSYSLLIVSYVPSKNLFEKCIALLILRGNQGA